MIIDLDSVILVIVYSVYEVLKNLFSIIGTTKMTYHTLGDTIELIE